MMSRSARLLGVSTVALASVLGGCSTGGSGGGEAGGQTTGAAPHATQATGTTGEPNQASTGNWDPNSWEPTVKITPKTFSDAEKQKKRTEWLKSLYPDMKNPQDVKLVRWSTSWPEYGETVSACMQEAGFNYQSDGLGSFIIPDGIPASQEQAAKLAKSTCDAMYTIEPQFMGDWSEEQLGLIYDYWTQYYIPCMEAQGYPLGDGQDRPTKETFVSTFFTPDRSPWWPPEATGTLPVKDQQRLNKVCPTEPPSKVFYGA